MAVTSENVGTAERELSELYKVTLTTRKQTIKSLTSNFPSPPSQDDGILSVTAYMPEVFTIALTANWEPSSGSGSSLAQGAAKAALNQLNPTSAPAKAAKEILSKLVSNSTSGIQTKIMTKLKYAGPSYLELQIPFLFVADKDPYKEVTKPAMELLKLTAGRTTGFGNQMIPPGPLPLLAYSLSDGEEISLRIGKTIYLGNVVVTAVSSQYNVRFDQYGNCNQAQVDVSLKTVFAIDRQDIIQMFGNIVQ